MPLPSAARLALLTVLLIAAGPAAAQPPAYERWSGGTAIAPTQGNYNQGTPLTLTWGFMDLGTAINDGTNAPNNLQTRLNAIYPGGQAVWQPHFESVFDRWSSVSGLAYQYEANDDGATMTNFSSSPSGVLGTRADVRIGGKAIDGNSNTIAYNYFPNHGDMVIDTNDTFFNNTNSNSLRLRNTVSHEHGHGIGMDHLDSTNGAFLMEPFINVTFDGPQYHDILSAQHMYGDAREKSNAGLGNDTSTLANALGTVANGGNVKIGESARTLAVAASATDFVSIDSSTDTDFYSIDVTAPGAVTIDLEALGFTYNVTPQDAGGNVAFDTTRRSNLALALFGTDGTTLLQSAATGGLGSGESITFNLTAAGTYFVRVTGTNNPDAIVLDTQFYGLSVGFVSPVPEPGAVLLVVGTAGGGWHLARRNRPASAV